MMRRAGVAALFAAVLFVLAGCTGTPSSGGSGDTGTTGGGTYTTPPVPADISLEQVWDEDGCVADAALVDGALVAGRRTNLCRATNPSNANYFYLYERGTDPATQWYQMYGIVEGYAYWAYPNGPWFRAPQNGGATEIEVTDAAGNKFFEDYQAWTEASLTNRAAAGGYNLNEVAKQGSMRIAELATFSNVSNNADARLADAQAEIARLQAELETKQQEQQQAAQGDGMDAEEVKIWQMEWNNRMARIWTQPDCNFSSNGCW